MSDNINATNVRADKNTYGKWKILNAEYFSNPEVTRALYALFERAGVELPDPCEIVEFGSAEGVVGEYFVDQFSHDHDVHLTLVDIVREHLLANKNPKVRKVHQDVLNYNKKGTFDLAIARSLLHYFSKEDQLTVIKNIFHSLKHDGLFLLQAFVQHEDDLELFLQLNAFVGKNIQLLGLDEIRHLLEQAGFSDISVLGDAPTWDCSSNNLQTRYNLSSEQLHEMSELIKKAPAEQRQGFKLYEDSFTVPIPYKVLIARRV